MHCTTPFVASLHPAIPAWNRCTIALAAILFALAPQARAADEWHLTFAIAETLVVHNPKPPAADAPSGPETTTTQSDNTCEASLGENYLVVTIPERTTIHDFAAKRSYFLEPGGESYLDTALYSGCGFRVQEVQNRFAIRRALQAAGVASQVQAGTPFDIEALLGVQVPGQGTLEEGAPSQPFTRTLDADGTIRFLSDSRVVTTFLPGPTEIPVTQQRAWERFLAHAWKLHPRVRAAIVADGHLPSRLEISSTDIARESHQVITLVQSTHAEARPPVQRVAGLVARTPLESKALQAVLARTWQENPPTREQTLAFAEEAMRARRPLDTLLALLEHGLQTGNHLTDEIRRHRLAFDKDERCRQFFSARDQSSKEACERSLAAYAAIDRTGLEKAYVMDIMRANALTSLRKRNEAEALFIAVLDRNPFLAGVYNDLGGVYYGSYDMQAAWACWDTARRLYPGHAMLAQVTALESRLERDFPVFF